MSNISRLNLEIYLSVLNQFFPQRKCILFTVKPIIFAAPIYPEVGCGFVFPTNKLREIQRLKFASWNTRNICTTKVWEFRGSREIRENQGVANIKGFKVCQNLRKAIHYIARSAVHNTMCANSFVPLLFFYIDFTAGAVFIATKLPHNHNLR